MRAWRHWASLMARTVKNLPAMQETQVLSLGWEDPTEKGMAIHSSILAWRIPWTEEPGGLQFMGSQRVGHDWATEHKVERADIISLFSQVRYYCPYFSLFSKYLMTIVPPGVDVRLERKTLCPVAAVHHILRLYGWTDPDTEQWRCVDSKGS